ncbi:hypothetical protein K490DRAFT_60153 [Saccharata proteae CBS 121410]|uniref:Flp pilus-assembly TadG-like N-terminal domain-containing protein n=1 Tax=Saccharata proteae CBS 121410 TaxID=1314787 RepID=A0A9P4HN31_9PEZI|nr:hypothetical protein K490DRAFT_60153 [Saccharata proteae CBS 121410]
MFTLLLAFSVFVVGLVVVDLHLGSTEARRSVQTARAAGVFHRKEGYVYGILAQGWNGMQDTVDDRQERMDAQKAWHAQILEDFLAKRQMAKLNNSRITSYEIDIEKQSPEGLVEKSVGVEVCCTAVGGVRLGQVDEETLCDSSVDDVSDLWEQRMRIMSFPKPQPPDPPPVLPSYTQLNSQPQPRQPANNVAAAETPRERRIVRRRAFHSSA